MVKNRPIWSPWLSVYVSYVILMIVIWPNVILPNVVAPLVHLGEIAKMNEREDEDDNQVVKRGNLEDKEIEGGWERERDSE